MTVAVDTTPLQRWGGMLAEETVAIVGRVGGAVADEQSEIEQQAQADVPVLTGRLKGSIRGTGRSPLRRRVRAGGAKAFYGRFQEFGTRHHSANPFLITQASRQRLDGFERKVDTAVREGAIYR